LTEEDRRRAAFLARAGLLAGPLDHPPGEAELEGLLLGLAEHLQVVRREQARFLRLLPGAIEVGDGLGEHLLPLSPQPATFRRRGGEARSGELALVPGDRLSLYLRDAQVLALVQEVDADGVARERVSAMASWTRFKTDGELAARVDRQYPGLGFAGFEVLDRGRSGRVGRIRLLGRDGDAAEVAGLAVRWLFDLPETLFTAQRQRPAEGRSGWLFSGKGWGHGVGLCQTGAYGMAGRGAGYRDILAHYYSGATLARLRPPAGR
jgi:stage II sporulation protein D